MVGTSPKLGGSVMDPGISASSIILLDLGYPNSVALLSPDLKVKEKRMSGGGERSEKEKFTICCGWHL